VNREDIAKRAFRVAAGMFSKKNASGIVVPDRLAQDGKPANLSVCVGVISGDRVDTSFAMALATTEYMVGRMGFAFFLCSMRGDIPAVNRNNAVEWARAQNCGWLLLLDSKMTFPPNALPRLLEAANNKALDIVGATYAQNVMPHANMAIQIAGTTASIENLCEVEALPAGFLLLRLAALEKMVRPYFWYPISKDGVNMISDHEYFCDAARTAGLKIWLDVELSQFMVHWGDCGYRLTGSPSENPEDRFERVELGAKPPVVPQPAANQSAASP
jgi:hypothetical protein